MRPLRFCHLTTFYPPHNFGGDGIGVQRLCRALAARGHHVTVVHETDAHALLRRGPEPVPEPEPEGIEVVRLASARPKLSMLLNQQLGRPVLQRRRIARILAQGRFDAINYHNISLVGGPGLLAMGDAAKLYMAHEHWLVCESHVLWRHGRELCTGRECLRCVLHLRRPPQWWRRTGALERAAAHVDVFIAMSEFSRAKHAEMGFRPPMEVLPYFLPDEPPPANPGPSPHPRPYFLVVGRLERLKGLDDVLPHFAGAGASDLVICGAGEHGDALRALASGHPRIHFAGRVASEALAAYYRHALALVVPSLTYETFGIILIEAFRAGTPVIARELGPLPEIVRLARGGELFASPEQLRASLQRLEREPGLREAYGRSARQAFLAHWSEGVVVPRYLALVEQALARRALRRAATGP